MRNGYTTGACAAAGLKAALLFEAGQPWQKVKITALDGTPLTIPIKAVSRQGHGFCAEVVKFSGDDPDITNGVSVFTTVEHQDGAGEMVFRAGRGIGVVTKPGLSVPVGEPSINPGPRELMRRTAKELLGTSDGLVVTISIPDGVELAEKTLNPVLGVKGGISVIGTTGVLRPMSEEGFKNSLVPQMDVAKAAGFQELIFVPGKIGENLAKKWGLPSGAVVQTSNFIGFMLEKAAEREIPAVLLFGHIGKLVKVAAGIFYTHNRIADARLETIAAYAAAEGLSTEGVRQILESNTTEDALTVLQEAHLEKAVCRKLAERAGLRAERYLFGRMKVGVVMVTLQGRLLGLNETAKKIGQHYHWQLPQDARNQGEQEQADA